MAQALLSLGSNLGQPARLLQQAREELRWRGLGVLGASRLWRTRAVGGPPGQGEFLNQALLVETSLPPLALLRVLLECEQTLGRVRHRRWAARTIDIDLLLYEQQVLHTAELQLPHPRMSFRRFVLQPAVEVAAGMVHPVAGRTLQDLLDHLDRAPAVVWIAEEVLWQQGGAVAGSGFLGQQGTRELGSPAFPPEKDVLPGTLEMERLSTPEELLAFLRRSDENDAPDEVPPRWGVWVGEELPATEAVPRLVVAGTFASDPQNWHKLHSRWQRAVGRMGPHLILPFADAGHLWQELSAAAWATCRRTILGPCEP